MNIVAELSALELIDKDEEEKECLLELSCEGLEEDVILKLDDKRRFKIAAGDLMEAVARISQPFPITKCQEDD